MDLPETLGLGLFAGGFALALANVPDVSVVQLTPATAGSGGVYFQIGDVMALAGAAILAGYAYQSNDSFLLWGAAALAILDILRVLFIGSPLQGAL